jgi:uncharacterized protein YjbI with pentapeptide repeats
MYRQPLQPTRLRRRYYTPSDQGFEKTIRDCLRRLREALTGRPAVSAKPPDVLCGDSSTWGHKDERIDLPRLLQLIEENGGPQGLDLHGCDMDLINAGPEALFPRVESYLEEHPVRERPRWLGDSSHRRPYRSRVRPLWLGGEGGVRLRGAHLENASLRDAHLENATLRGAHLENAIVHRANLRRALLEGAHLENAQLWAAELQDAGLARAHLENANLVDAHLENASLYQAHLENADLGRARLQNADLEGAHLHGAFWYEAYLDGTRIRRECLGRAIGDELAAKGRVTPSFPFHDAREAYLALKANFESIGRYHGASWAYVKEQQMEKAMHFPTTRGHRWIRERIGGAVPPPWCGPHHLPSWIRWKLRSGFYHCRLFVGLCPADVRRDMARWDRRGEERNEWLSRWRWARNWAYELLTGYGERPQLPVICALVVVLLFAVIYAAAGNIAAGDVGALQGQPTHSPVTALVHSISAFATIGFNTLEPQGWGARLLTAIEAMFGIGLFALFVFTLGNRMRRS